MEDGKHCLQIPVCATEAAGRKTEIGMSGESESEMVGTSGVPESFSTGPLEIGKG